MNKKELVKRVHARARQQMYTKEDVHNLVSFTLDVVQCALENGEEITINELGKFYITEKKAFMCVSNLKGTVTRQPSRSLIQFKPSKKLSERLNKERSENE